MIDIKLKILQITFKITQFKVFQKFGLHLNLIILHRSPKSAREPFSGMRGEEVANGHVEPLFDKPCRQNRVYVGEKRDLWVK